MHTKVNLTASDVDRKRTIYSSNAPFAILSVSARSTEIDKTVHSLIISLPLFRSLIHVRPILCLISQHLSDALAEVRRRNYRVHSWQDRPCAERNYRVSSWQDRQTAFVPSHWTVSVNVTCRNCFLLKTQDKRHNKPLPSYINQGDTNGRHYMQCI